MLNRFNTNLAFVDLLFNLLIGFVSLFIIAWLLINPIAKTGKIDPKTEILIIMEWPKESRLDIDIWVLGPDGSITSFINKDQRYIVLERDDLGVKNDKVKINGKEVEIQRNIETVNINKLLNGEYVINIFNYSKELYEGREEKYYPTPVKVSVYKMDPFKLIFQGENTLIFRQEKTVVYFVVDQKRITDVRTDVYIPLYGVK